MRRERDLSATMPSQRVAIAPLAVFALALTARAITAANIHFPIPEDSAYYVAAAQNLATGRGLVVDVVWSYATPPLVLPRPAFDLWQPLASILASPVMAVFGPRLAAAQASSVLIGALAAPLAWAVARRAADTLGLPPVRAAVAALTAGLLVAFTPLLVVQAAEPDSSAPFTALVLAAAWLIPDALAERPPSMRARALLGLTLGLAYLTRQEAIYLVAAYAVIAAVAAQRDPGRPAALRRTLPALGVALLVVAPWLVRQAVTWQTSPLAQAVENAWVVHQTDLFGWAVRPSAAAHLALGAGGMLGLRSDALVGDVALLLATGFPAALVGLATVAVRPRLVGTPALRALAIAGALTFAVDVVVFPVAGTSGLWAHGAGPTIALLAVLGGLGLDAAIERLVRFRGWRQPSGPLTRVAFVAPLIALAWTVPLTMLTAQLENQQATETAAQYEALGEAVTKWGLTTGSAIVTDHPMWLSAALGRGALALPRETPTSVLDLARHFGASAVVVRDPDADFAAQMAGLLAYRSSAGGPCFQDLPAPPPFRALMITCP